jgi:hypothetical protein
MDNKIGCTCALQSGGSITANGQWRSPRVYRGGINLVFQNCVRDAGGSTD